MDDYVTHTRTHTPSQEHKRYWCSEHFLVLSSLENGNGNELLESRESVPLTHRCLERSPGTLWALNKHSLVQVAPPASKFQDLKIFNSSGPPTLFWEDDQESFLEEAARQERHMMDGKAEGQVPVCQPVTKMFSREHSWERRWEAGPVRGVRAAGQPGFPGNRGLEVPRSPPAWGYRLGEVGSQFSSGSIRRFFSSFLNSLLSNDSWGMELCSPATKSLLCSGLAMKKPLPEGKPSLWGRKPSPQSSPCAQLSLVTWELQGQGRQDKRALVVRRLPAVPGTLSARCHHPPRHPPAGGQGCPFRGDLLSCPGLWKGPGAPDGCQVVVGGARCPLSHTSSPAMEFLPAVGVAG